MKKISCFIVYVEFFYLTKNNIAIKVKEKKLEEEFIVSYLNN